MEQPSQPTLSNYITVTLGEKEEQLFLSFNKLNNICFLVGNIENAASIMIHPEMREAALRQLFSSKDVKPAAVDLDGLDISHEDATRVLDWLMQHVTVFTLGILEKAARFQDSPAMQRRVGDLAGSLSLLMPTKTGPEDSSSESSAV